MKPTVHKYDNVILGSTIEALIYAYITGYPVFFAGSRCPKQFEYFEPDFSFPNMENSITTLNTNKGKIERGISKQELWIKLVFLLSVGGQIPITETPSSFRFDGELVRIVLGGNNLIKIQPQTIYLFDDLDMTGFPHTKKTKGIYAAYDWLEFNSMYRHEYDLIYTDDSPINELHFIPPSNENRYKDGCLVSYFNNQKEMDRELTEFAIKLKLKDVFKQYQIKGKANGVYHMNKSIQRYKQVQYTFVRREVEKPYNIHEDFDNVKYCCYTVESLMAMMKPNKTVDNIWKNIQSI